MEFTKFKDWIVLKEMGVVQPQQKPNIPNPMQIQNDKRLGAIAARIAKQQNLQPGKITPQQKQSLLNNPEIHAAGKDMSALMQILTGE